MINNTQPQPAYAYVIERADDGAYWAYFPDLPGCVTSGDTVEDVERQLPEAVALYLSHGRMRGQPDPTAVARVGVLASASLP
jgi:predicted RNase H-like HicB family nuclease